MRPRCALPYIIRTNGDQMNNQTTKTISVPEAGRVYFGLARNAAYEAAHRGDIPVIRIGRMLRVPDRRAGADARGGKANAARLNMRRAARCCDGEKGKFPRVSLAGKSYVWPEEEIDAWLENKRAAREEAIAR